MPALCLGRVSVVGLKRCMLETKANGLCMLADRKKQVVSVLTLHVLCIQADLLHVLFDDFSSIAISPAKLLFLLMIMATTALPPMTPEYMNENRGPAFVAVFSAGLAVAIVLVALRLWVRFKVVRKVGVDDYVMLASMVSKNKFVRCGP